jgi:hypothetical protein
MTAPVGEHQYVQACGGGTRHGPCRLSGDACTYSTEHSQRGLSTCLQATRDVDFWRSFAHLQQQEASRTDAAAADERCINKDRERCKRIASGSAWRLGSSTSTGLRFSVIGRNHIDAALSTTTQPCPRFTLTPLKSCFNLPCTCHDSNFDFVQLAICTSRSTAAQSGCSCRPLLPFFPALGADGKERRSCEMRVPCRREIHDEFQTRICAQCRWSTD